LNILFAGTMREKKGIQYAVKGFADAVKAGAPLMLHLVAEAADKPGDRETEAEIAKLIDSPELRGRVVRYKLMPFQDLLALALKMHVFLAPSVTAADGDSEGTPFVLQQMMATGMPAIATVHSDIPFLFGQFDRLLVPERDTRAITDRLVEYASNPQLLFEHGQLMRKQVLEHLDVRDCAARLSDLYNRIGVTPAR
jgi:colanic acid/amylovoran biosynthesis glycosyltransferase